MPSSSLLLAEKLQDRFPEGGGKPQADSSGGDPHKTMEPHQRLQVAVFFCQQLDPQQDLHSRELEHKWGSSILFFPMHCSGRVEALHLLKALEEGADRVLVLTCPEGRCRYREGSLRAQKRLEYARSLLEEIGLEPSRLELRASPAQSPRHIARILEPILEEPWEHGPCALKSGGAEGRNS
jgi:F420-non-reducing hydrogenase iron-sulfur subunit